MKVTKSFLIIAILSLSLLVFQAPHATSYTPRQGDSFNYYEVENLGNGTGTYTGYSEHTVVNGSESMTGVSPNGTVSAKYGYSWTWNNSTGTSETGSSSGKYTWSSSSFHYVNGTDNQTGYVNPTVWFYMNSMMPKGGTFYILNTQMTVLSANYSYYLPSQKTNVEAIFAQGNSSYLRNDEYGIFNAEYTWNAYFDPVTGFIIGYSYVEHDTNSSGTGFTYTDDLYVTSTSYSLLATTSTESTNNVSGGNSGLTQHLSSIATIVLVIAIIAIIIYALSKRKRKSLPEHPPSSPLPPEIDLTPNQPPVQQIVIKEVAKVKCNYCGAMMDSTAQVCPRCGAPRT